MTVHKAELAKNRVRKRTDLDVSLDTNNPGDGRIYRLELRGRILFRARTFREFEALCDALIEGYEWGDRVRLLGPTAPVIRGAAP
jgi:hypothetical protein